jgi:hypothetical protein
MDMGIDDPRQYEFSFKVDNARGRADIFSGFAIILADSNDYISFCGEIAGPLRGWINRIDAAVQEHQVGRRNVLAATPEKRQGESDPQKTGKHLPHPPGLYFYPTVLSKEKNGV